jgi:hypothetical protein
LGTRRLSAMGSYGSGGVKVHQPPPTMRRKKNGRAASRICFCPAE